MHPSPPLAPDMCPLLSWLLCLLVLASLAVLPSSTGAQGLAEVVKSLIVPRRYQRRAPAPPAAVSAAYLPVIIRSGTARRACTFPAAMLLGRQEAVGPPTEAGLTGGACPPGYRSGVPPTLKGDAAAVCSPGSRHAGQQQGREGEGENAHGGFH